MLKGKTAVVTGGSRGIGAAIVCKLASMGANAAVIYAGNAAAAENLRRKKPLQRSRQISARLRSSSTMQASPGTGCLR